MMADHYACEWINPPDRELIQHRLHHRVFRSALHGAWVGYTAFLPDAYRADPTIARPLICFLHGSGGDERPADGHLRMANALDAAIADGRIPPCLMVWPNGGRPQYEDLADGSLQIRRMFNEEWFPYLLHHYPIAPGGLHLQGFSMGGWGAIKCAIDGAQRFASITSFAGALIDVEARAAAADVRTQHLHYRRIYNADRAYYRSRCIYHQAHRLRGDLHFFCGDRDLVLPRNRAYSDLLTGLGIPHHLSVVPDCGHDMADYHEHWLAHTCRLLNPDGVPRPPA